jgi:hypothetical protein
VVPFSDACALIGEALRGDRRGRIAAEVSRGDLGASLVRLRERMRRHDWGAAERGRATLERMVRDYDRRTRAEGLHALHDWDGKADHVNEDSIPVDVLSFVIRRRGSDAPDPAVAAILIDYYFVYLLALLSLRIWDEGDPDANLDSLSMLLAELQGPGGSGQRFASDAETLILLATSHFELEERGYVLLLERVRSMSHAHQTRIALGHAVTMGCHLRFGFEATYGRDTVAMRDDNSADYPWLCFSLAVLMKEYERLSEPASDNGEPVVEAMVNGLSADARAFVGDAPKALSSCDDERAAFRAAFLRHRDALLRRFEVYRPSPDAYSPLSFFFNFSHNVLKGMVVDALLRGRAWRLTLNDLLTSASRGDGGDTQTALARTLMAYARAAPDRIGGRLMPVIVYDPSAGRRAFAVTMRKLQQ